MIFYCENNYFNNFREQNLIKESVVTALLKKFQISEEEIAFLQGENGNVFLTYEIFSILDKIENIHKECKTLMESGLQNLGLGLMEQIKQYQVMYCFCLSCNVYVIFFRKKPLKGCIGGPNIIAEILTTQILQT